MTEKKIKQEVIDELMREYTSTVEIAKHTHTRNGRRLRSMEEKRRIVEEVLRGEESVAAIARRYEVNANLSSPK